MKSDTYPYRLQIMVTKEMMAKIKKWAKVEQSMISPLIRKVLNKNLKGRK